MPKMSEWSEVNWNKLSILENLKSREWYRICTTRQL